MGPFAAVRFETLPRLAELLGAGRLAMAGRSPLARPIGDYLAEQVARESGEAFSEVRELAGYARVLRQLFRRLRRGGIVSSGKIAGSYPAHGMEVFRLYDRFREASAEFYDEEDLLDAAAEAVETDQAGALADLGAIYVAPPGALTGAGTRFLLALKARAPDFREIGESEGSPVAQRFLLAPDPASEARMVVREVLSALATGVPVHEIAVFHGAGSSYGRLLRETFESARVPVSALPGVPLIETRAGRGVLALAELPANDFSRAAAMELLSVAPLKGWVPGDSEDVRVQTNSWDRVSREAGITRGRVAWEERLRAFVADRDGQKERLAGEENEARVRAIERERDSAAALQDVVTQLFARLEPLRSPQRAEIFIESFKGIVSEYFDAKSEALEGVVDEIDQLGTVGAVGGEFSLESFTWALRANLEQAAGQRRTRFGEGVTLAEYRVAGGLEFPRVVICGAFEGAMPAGPGNDAILDDRIWRRLRQEHPFIEDATTRIARSREAAMRAIAAAGGGELMWSAPSFEPGGAREYYPSPMMAEAYSRVVGRRVTASELRAEKTWEITARPGSAMGSMLAGPVVDEGEAALRGAIQIIRSGDMTPGHARRRSVEAFAARRGTAFTEWDGNLAQAAAELALGPGRAVSPTSLESYGTCGFKYFGRSVLRLNVVEEPDERQVMDARDRGSLIHAALERFFIEKQSEGRPRVREAWNTDDEARLLEIAREEIAKASERGTTGLPVYAQHEVRTIESDLRLFLGQDSMFRFETGAVPAQFEYRIPEAQVAGVTLRGFVDRIDRTEDGQKAWVIDYKTGSSWDKTTMPIDNPLASGQKLQLPVYLAAVADVPEGRAMYWYNTQRGGFEKHEYENTPENRELFEATLGAIVDGIGSGAFPAIPLEDDEFRNGFKNCLYCDFDRICSRRRDFEQKAKEADPGMQAWAQVGVTARRQGQ